MSTPSIVQQRIILAVLMAVVGAMVWWQNAGARSDHPVQKFSQTPMPSVLDKLDFTSAEAAWSALQVDSQGNLKIDALTETALVDAMAVAQSQPSELTVARMAFLLEKQFGRTATQQIMELLPKLQIYKQREQRWWEENGSKNPPPHAELFQLQDELLGETLAGALFSEQRRLLNMMEAIRQIRADGSLTEAQKDQALMNLQNPVRDEGVPIE